MNNEIRKILIDIHEKHGTPIYILAELAGELISSSSLFMAKPINYPEEVSYRKEKRSPQKR